jgi:hypothetical protein
MKKVNNPKNIKDDNISKMVLELAWGKGLVIGLMSLEMAVISISILYSNKYTDILLYWLVLALSSVFILGISTWLMGIEPNEGDKWMVVVWKDFYMCSGLLIMTIMIILFEIKPVDMLTVWG